MTNSLTTITGGLAFYVFFGLLIIGWRFVPALLGYEGAYAEDMASSALPVFIALWILCLPIFILIGVSIEMILALVRVVSERTGLR